MLHSVRSLQMMDSFDGLSENVVTSPVGRKRKRDKSKRDNLKIKRELTLSLKFDRNSAQSQSEVGLT